MDLVDRKQVAERQRSLVRRVQALLAHLDRHIAAVGNLATGQRDVQEIGEVVERLVSGGYPVSTPVAVVYKATWPDCQVVRGTLADIAEQVTTAGIHKTALILVGAFLGDEYHYSKLYDAGFSHEYRQA